MSAEALSPRQFTGWDKSGDEPRWVQPHDDLVRDALHSWKGSPTDMHRNLRELDGPTPPSGTGKIWRAQAQALHHEVSNAPPTPLPLYRGAAHAPDGVTGWSERRSVANAWARRNNGMVHALPAGGGRGIRIADHISSGLDDAEKEWLVHEPKGYTTSPPVLKKRTRK